MLLVFAHNLYLEVVSGEHDDAPKDWYDPNPMKLDEFLMQWSLQAMQYNPSNFRYPGEEILRSNTKKNTNKRKKQKRKLNPGDKLNVQKKVKLSVEMLEFHAHKVAADAPPAIVYCRHISEATNSSAICKFCGFGKCYHRCLGCRQAHGKYKGSSLPLCNSQHGGNGNSWGCHALYHMKSLVGMAYCDQTTRKGRVNWLKNRENNMKAISAKLEKMAEDYAQQQKEKV